MASPLRWVCREGLDTVAWAAANQVTSEMEGAGKRKLVVGLRGLTYYGSVLSGPLGADKPAKAADPGDRSIFFAAFAPQAATR